VHRISTERRYSPPLPSPSLPSYSHPPCCCCCCCCDEDTLPIWGRGDNNVSKRWGILPDSESGGNRLSLIVVSLTVAPLPRWHHCHGGCCCPQLTYCRPLSLDVDGWHTVKLQSVSCPPAADKVPPVGYCFYEKHVSQNDKFAAFIIRYIIWLKLTATNA